MGLPRSIPTSEFPRLLEAAFEETDVAIYSAYSEFGQSIEKFDCSDAAVSHYKAHLANGRLFFHYLVHYRDCGGHIDEQRISLNPKRCKGHTFRYAIRGWGLIQLQADLKEGGMADCRVAVNSEKRAWAWSSQYSDLRSPDLWDWPSVGRHARRLNNRLRGLAQQALARDVRNARA
jgi:hypothetical protein